METDVWRNLDPHPQTLSTAEHYYSGPIPDSYAKLIYKNMCDYLQKIKREKMLFCEFFRSCSYLILVL